MPVEPDGELKGKPAEGHQINFCDQCDGLFCESCTDAEDAGLFCSKACEKKYNEEG